MISRYSGSRSNVKLNLFLSTPISLSPKPFPYVRLTPSRRLTFRKFKSRVCGICMHTRRLLPQRLLTPRSNSLHEVIDLSRYSSILRLTPCTKSIDSHDIVYLLNMLPYPFRYTLVQSSRIFLYIWTGLGMYFTNI